MAAVKFRVHYDAKSGGREQLDVIASSPDEAADSVRRLRQGAIVVKVKVVRE